MFGVHDLTVAFGGRPALDGVSLAAPTGSVTTVVGGDGAGKSTLLRVMAGLTAADGGTVSTPPKGQIGLLPAGAGSWATLTVDENLAFAASAAGVRRGPRLDALIERAGLGQARDRLAARLSGGMRRKLGVIMALVGEPELVLLDEPTTGVDPVSRVELWALISGAAADGAAVVTATTYLDEAERATEVAVLHRGRVVLAGEPAAIVEAADGEFWVDDEARSTAWRRGRSYHHWAPVAPTGVTRLTPDLEDVVIAATFGDAPERPVDAAPIASGNGLPLLRAADVTKSFGDVQAVRGVDLEVREGEIVGLLGANGAGKTTLMRCLLGILAPTTGKAELFGEPPSRSTRARLGYVPQGMGLYRDLTLAENADFSASVYGVTAPEGGDRRLVAEVPLGEQRRAAFDIALAHGPGVLVLDEPTSGVSPREAADLWAAIGREAERGVGVLVTTHNMGEAAQCDRLLLLVDGRVVARGSMADVLGGATVTSVALDDWQGAFDALVSAGYRVGLSGRSVRVLSDDEAGIRAVVGEAAQLARVPATLEERMAL